MKRALVVVTPGNRGRRLLREAGAYAEGTDTELVLLTVVPEEEFEEKRRAVAEIGSSDAVYTLEQAEESAEREATTVADDALAGLDVSYHAVGTIGREADAILDVADSEDAEHVFLGSRRRSPAGKALFGDVAQTVLLEFDGPVTLLMGEDVDETPGTDAVA
ncbi:Nucleotide-binding universal stress protein, UspA family [Halogeometricum rufum]|jgi:nucleotide-binding universal stress UspA family protein|uniref:Nucleotide-binding universal stress protein, UspA family n=1 Tax=Halogeometricum rufum TaxID=553469 RepID=A0A1I6I1R3_9EURY|nr:universal stress protein [Halogeometricum rufum]SFR60604.1 Nucleotide-binding universal stress protein, UspA family [Halogeometricum rufum]